MGSRDYAGRLWSVVQNKIMDNLDDFTGVEKDLIYKPQVDFRPITAYDRCCWFGGLLFQHEVIFNSIGCNFLSIEIAINHPRYLLLQRKVKASSFSIQQKRQLLVSPVAVYFYWKQIYITAGISLSNVNFFSFKR